MYAELSSNIIDVEVVYPSITGLYKMCILNKLIHGGLNITNKQSSLREASTTVCLQYLPHRSLVIFISYIKWQKFEENYIMKTFIICRLLMAKYNKIKAEYIGGHVTRRVEMKSSEVHIYTKFLVLKPINDIINTSVFILIISEQVSSSAWL